MFTIKAYNCGHTYIDNCDSVEIFDSTSPIFDEEVKLLNEGFVKLTGSDEDAESPFAFIRTTQGNMNGIRPLFEHDTAYVLNDYGKTIESVRFIPTVSD